MGRFLGGYSTPKEFEVDWSGDYLTFSTVEEGVVILKMEAKLIGIPITHMTVTTGWGSRGSWTVELLDGPSVPYSGGSGNVPAAPWTRNTINKYDYIRGIVGPVGESTRTRFSVAANNDAHIALGTNELHSSPKYEIVLGGWRNEQSVIRYSNGGPKQDSHSGPVMAGYNNP